MTSYVFRSSLIYLPTLPCSITSYFGAILDPLTYPKIGCHLWTFPKHFLLTSYKSVLAISTSGQQAIKCNFNTNLKQASIVECVPICMTLPCHPLALVSDGSMQEMNCQGLCPTLQIFPHKTCGETPCCKGYPVIITGIACIPTVPVIFEVNTLCGLLIYTLN